MPRPPIEPPFHDIGPVPQPEKPPARDFIPHTTHEKAALYLVLAPPLEALAEELMALNRKTVGLAAEPQVVAQAAALLRDCRRLLRGEPGAHLVDLDFTPPVRVQALALGLRQLVAAVSGFRDRYYGYNPLTDGPAWAVADPFGNPDPRWLGRPATVERAIDELNLMTAEVLRTQLIDLAERRQVKLPPDLRRAEDEPEEPELEKPDGTGGGDPPEPPPLPPWPSNSRRRSRRYIRAAKWRGQRRRGEWSPPGSPVPAPELALRAPREKLVPPLPPALILAAPARMGRKRNERLRVGIGWVAGRRGSGRKSGRPGCAAAKPPYTPGGFQ